jgi:hypothetical protein
MMHALGERHAHAAVVYSFQRRRRAPRAPPVVEDEAVRKFSFRVGVERTTRRGRSLLNMNARVARRPERDLISFGHVAAGVRHEALQAAVRAAQN